jgi:hypothetical protein
MKMGIADRLGNKAESWGSKEEPLIPGDRIIGTVVAVTEGESTYGPYPIIEIEVKTGTEQDKKIPEGTLKAWHVFATVAKNEVAKQKPARNDEIGSEFLGTKATKPGSAHASYDDWHVIVEKATGPIDTPDWGAHAEAAADEGVADFAQGTPPPFLDDEVIEPFLDDEVIEPF